MNIGINARVFCVDTPDGSAQVGIRHTENLLKNSNYSCTLYGHSDSQRQFNNAPPIRNIFFQENSQPYGVMWERTVLPILTSRDNLDILFCPNANAPPIKGGNHRTVMMIHHVGAEEGHSPIQRFYRKLMIPLGARSADAVVTVSEFSKRKILEHLSIDESKVHVIYNGVDQLFFEENAGVSIDLPDEYILFVGSADRRKNLGRLLEAYNEFDNDIEFVVVGPQNSIAYGQENFNRDDVLNLGYVTRKELRYIYEQATLFAYPSLYEGFGLPPLEAAACGTPVLTSNVSAIPEVMGDAAEFVDPYSVESIHDGLKIIDDQDRLEELSSKGKKRAQQFTWGEATNRLLNVFEEVI